MYSLLGKTALITGASRGIGREFALTLAQCGADIVVNYVSNEQKALEVKEEIESLGRRCLLAKSDLSNKNCANEIAQVINKVDILILNASVQYRNNLQNIACEEFDEQINCNFRSAFLLIQKFVPHMIENKWGRIITVGSVQELKPHPQMLIYSSTKAALTLMAKSLAIQLAPYGITVNSIAPGVILTDRNEDVLADEDYRNSTLNKIPMGCFGNTSDLSGMLKVLCTDEGRYITGQNIFIDGAMGIK